MIEILVNPIVSNLLNLFIGLATSFISWWVLFQKFVPKIEFYSFISKIESPEGGGGYIYRVKFRNTGKRGIIGVEVFARLILKKDGNNFLSAVYIPLSRDGERKLEIPKITGKFDHTPILYPNLVESFRINSNYSEEFFNKAKSNRLTMEDLLSLKNATLKIYVSGYDEFSGARKLFESSDFTIGDIRATEFDG